MYIYIRIYEHTKTENVCELSEHSSKHIGKRQIITRKIRDPVFTVYVVEKFDLTNMTHGK